MSEIKQGDTVKVHYTGTLQDGSVFDSSREREPLQFEIGSGSLIPGFENAVLGLSVGESTKVDIPSGEAYGEVREDMIISVERDKLPADIDPKVGMQLQVQQQNGQAMPVVISDVNETHITIDANHPLAGRDLTFEIELVEVV
ncbi:peptidylprolyl isomerase [Cyclonatronum proteinivorum]|uniref:Peptidyl-prolyl cis-trans isomerase n=1 Tax=Cyclonatronum proteinivorum TaxID=1457365 RepID=A0A345UJH5_9BACT|nr:peptidylprolyl isomerase [Cyclonatronum proteinivorum]AXJ00627.1 peptidylprolyl isomerase [Cyclonatronum proteinivorum]